VPSYAHKRLISAMNRLSQIPPEDDDAAFAAWLDGATHLAFLADNAQADEILTHAVGPNRFIQSVVVPNERLASLDHTDLLSWDIRSNSGIASYWQRNSGEVYIKRGLHGVGSATLEHAIPLLFKRPFDGHNSITYEINQEYLHLTETHWLPEQRAYCRYNKHDDLDHVISLSTNHEHDEDTMLVSFQWAPLEEYLVVNNAALVRLFDFTLFHPSNFSGFGENQPYMVHNSESLFYHKILLAGYASFQRGVQIIRPRTSKAIVFDRIMGTTNDRKYVTFTAFDWRHNIVVDISTDPSETTNYFNADQNDLPYELSPAFFRPAVLTKYKADRDKYTVTERSVSSRTQWDLNSIDINDAGQIHAYICDLRLLPYDEQVYWLSHNEAPKDGVGISERAFLEDFMGNWANQPSALENVLLIIRSWHLRKVRWWQLRDEKLLDRVTIPLTTSRDEWGDSLMDLAKLVVEGFEVKVLRKELDKLKIVYSEKDQSLNLLSKIVNRDRDITAVEGLVGLRTVQGLRSKVKGHATGGAAEQLAQEALNEHETYANHFRHVCTLVAADLARIEQSFSPSSSNQD